MPPPCGPCRHTIANQTNPVRLHWLAGLARTYQRTDTRQQFSPVRDCILQRIEAANQERRGADIVVMKDRTRDLVGCPNEAGGISLSTGPRRNPCPEPPVEPAPPLPPHPAIRASLHWQVPRHRHASFCHIIVL